MGFFTKTVQYLREHLGKTRNKIASSLSAVLTLGRDIDDALLDQLEETLISDDIGVETTDRLIEDLREAYKSKQIAKTDDIIPFLKEHMKNYWPEQDRQLNMAESGPTVVLVAGVNGSGKTTSIAKLAYTLSRNDQKVIVAAGTLIHGTRGMRLAMGMVMDTCGLAATWRAFQVSRPVPMYSLRSRTT